VVRDAEGQFGAATSTGGTPFKPPGRVGDSPLPGSGFYATEDAAVSSTGWGEAIAAVVLAHTVTTEIHAGSAPEDAARSALRDMHDRIRNPNGDGARAGLIVLSNDAAAWAYTTPRMARALWTPNTRTIWLDETR
jgi:beta-aspartyl-peptidase (threonine type)